MTFPSDGSDIEGADADPVNAQTLPGTTIVLPELPTVLPESCHPDCAYLDAATAHHNRALLRTYFGTDDRTDRYLRQRISHYGCLVFPQANYDCAAALAELCLAATLCDDSFSRPGVQSSQAATARLHQRWLAIFNDEPAGDDEPALRLAQRALRAADALMTLDLAARARQTWRDIADSHRDEADDRHHHRTLKLDTYMERRLTNVYGWWLTTHVEFAAGIDLVELARHPDVMAIRRPAIRHITLVNDLYSFPKEIDAHEAMNVLLTLIRHDHLPIQEVIDRVAVMISDAEIEYRHRCDALLAGSLGTRADVRAYAEGIGYLMTGNLRWSQISTRYFGDQHDGHPMTAGPLILSRHPTVHT